MRGLRPVLVGLAGAGFLTLCVGALGQAVAPVTLQVDAAAGRHAISPEIYGIVSYDLDPGFAAEIKVPNVRWGGDGTTRYNWKVDSTNAGFDWYFMSGSGKTPVAGAGVDAMLARYGAVGARGLVTIPIIPLVNKSAELGCSFPVSVYGKQQSVNPYEHPHGGDCGNSLTVDGKQLLDKDVYANHVDNSVGLQREWVEHLVAKFGTAAKGGVPFYQLDNEPYGWGNTHRDVMPVGADYATIVRLGEQYAAMVKEVDPSAMVLGPSDFTHAGWIGDLKKQDGLFAGEFYLRAMAAYGKAHGRVLDYFDEHYYPEFGSHQDGDGASQMAATRTLWDAGYDGGTWVEKSYFHGPMRLIPRFREWIAAYYPGTKLAFSEYSIDSGKKRIEDALAEADLLGIFGAQGVDLANMWVAPKPDEPMAFAFRVFRNYDGKGGMFGETGVQAVSSDVSRMAVYAAERGSDGAVTIVVLNKTSQEIKARVALRHVKGAGVARVYEYGGGDLKRIVDRGTVKVGAEYGFPGMSATVMVVGR
jgi:hypothetical protein